MPRAPRPDDLYRLRIADRTAPVAGRPACVVVVAPDRRPRLRRLSPRALAGPTTDADGAAAPADPRREARPACPLLPGRPDARLPLGPAAPRRGGTGRRPRRLHGDRAKDREDVVQVYLLPLDGGEARRLTDLPRGVDAFEWSPDGSRLVVVSTSHGATRAEDDRRRGIDRRREPGHAAATRTTGSSTGSTTCSTAPGFTYDRVGHLWLVDVATGEASRLTDGRAADDEPAWSPDGARIAFVSNRRRDADLTPAHTDIHVVDVATRAVTARHARPAVDVRRAGVAAGRQDDRRARPSDARAAPGVRNDIWLFAADGSRRDADRRAEPVGAARPDAAAPGWTAT